MTILCFNCYHETSVINFKRSPPINKNPEVIGGWYGGNMESIGLHMGCVLYPLSFIPAGRDRAVKGEEGTVVRVHIHT
jgi:hypothetical protein